MTSTTTTKTFTPAENTSLGLLIGKKFTNINKIVNDANDKYGSKPSISINNKDNTFTIKALSEEISDYVFSELSTLEQSFKKFEHILNIKNIKPGYIKNSIVEVLSNTLDINNFNVWVHTNGEFGRLFLRHKEDLDKTVGAKFDNFSLVTIDQTKKKFVKYEHSLFLNFSSEANLEEVDAYFSTRLEENYKLWIGDNKRYGKLFLKESVNVVDVLKYDGMKFLDCVMSVSESKTTFSKREKFENVLNINNMPETLDFKNLNELIENFVPKDNFNVWIHESGKFGKIFVKTEEDRGELINNVNNCYYDDNKIKVYDPDDAPTKSHNHVKYDNVVDIRNISYELTNGDVGEVVGKYIENFRVSLVEDKRNPDNNNRGFGRVFIKDYEEAEICVKSLNRQGFHGTIWSVQHKA